MKNVIKYFCKFITFLCLIILLKYQVDRINKVASITGLLEINNSRNDERHTSSPLLFRSNLSILDFKKITETFLPLSPQTLRTVNTYQNERKLTIKRVCEKKMMVKPNDSADIDYLRETNNIIVDDKHKLLFCYIPKVGCTSWKAKLAAASGAKINLTMLTRHPSVLDNNYGLSKFGLQLLSKYSNYKVNYILKNYYKFLFTRHPFERILSAYRSKWEKRTDNKGEYKYFYKTMYREVTNVIQKNSSDDDNQISFQEFIKYLVKRSKYKRKMEPHFERFHVLCKMCHINYDFIGKFDTIYNDISFVLHQIFDKSEDYYFPNVSNPKSSKRLLLSYYTGIPRTLLEQLEEAYKIDFELFGYNHYTFNDINIQSKNGIP